MTKNILLEASGFDFSFEIDYRRSDNEYVGMIVVFRLDPHLGNVIVQSEPTSIATKDLRRLVLYLEQHIDRLLQDSWSESYVFVNDELGFQIQAQAGELISSCEGDFSIRCTVNVAKTSEGMPGVYVGAEADVNLEQVRAFINATQALLAELSTSAPSEFQSSS
jgi:hypothetical protein